MLLTDAVAGGRLAQRAMIQSARRTILLVDSSKFQAPGFCTCCDLSAIAEVITDDGIAPEHLSALRSASVKVTVVATVAG